MLKNLSMVFVAMLCLSAGADESKVPVGRLTNVKVISAQIGPEESLGTSFKTHSISAVIEYSNSCEKALVSAYAVDEKNSPSGTLQFSVKGVRQPLACTADFSPQTTTVLIGTAYRFNEEPLPEISINGVKVK